MITWSRGATPPRKGAIPLVHSCWSATPTRTRPCGLLHFTCCRYLRTCNRLCCLGSASYLFMRRLDLTGYLYVQRLDSGVQALKARENLLGADHPRQGYFVAMTAAPALNEPVALYNSQGISAGRTLELLDWQARRPLSLPTTSVETISRHS